MKGDLLRCYRCANIELAFMRIQRDKNRQYKSYFRDIYQSYALSGARARENLGKRLRDGVYVNTESSKTYVPKPSLIQRPVTLLGIEDQIVYQAMVNIVADALYPVAQPDYFEKTFGNLYAGPGKEFFYVDWRRGYKLFTEALIKHYNDGYVWIASFDLTACFDSIDHHVLEYFMKDLGLDQEFCDELKDRLKHWSAASLENPIYQGHGIPQGPMASGLLAECVLREFDRCPAAQNESTKYLRYVDDIKIMAKEENELRRQLLELDRCSKRIGLFPQSSKINIHVIKSIKHEVKTISVPDLPCGLISKNYPERGAIEAIRILTKNLVIQPADESAFKYWLPELPTLVKHGTRILRLLERYPHLSSPIASWLSGFKVVPKSLSVQILKTLNEQSLYSGALAEFIDMLSVRVHPECQDDFVDLCLRLQQDSLGMSDPVLRAAVKMVLIGRASEPWRERKKILVHEKDWWVLCRLVGRLNPEGGIRHKSLESILNKCIRSKHCDVGVVAAEKLGSLSMDLLVKSAEIPLLSVQHSLKNQRLLGRIRHNVCPVRDCLESMTAGQWPRIDWKSLLGSNYQSFAEKTGRWKSYATSNPSAWLNIADTFNDLILESLSTLDPNLIKYKQGNIGNLFHKVKRARASGGGGSKMLLFANDCPCFFEMSRDVHERRNRNELSHPKERYSNKATTHITHREKEKILRGLPRAYIEIWHHYEKLST